MCSHAPCPMLGRARIRIDTFPPGGAAGWRVGAGPARRATVRESVPTPAGLERSVGVEGAAFGGGELPGDVLFGEREQRGGVFAVAGVPEADGAGVVERRDLVAVGTERDGVDGSGCWRMRSAGSASDNHNSTTPPPRSPTARSAHRDPRSADKPRCRTQPTPRLLADAAQRLAQSSEPERSARSRWLTTVVASSPTRP